MTPLPKKKSTRSRTNQRKGTFKKSLPAASRCPSCKKLKMPHKACPHCGFYK